MQCSTIKVGVECKFMRREGCGFPGGACKVIVEQCEGCEHVQEWPSGKYCDTWADPAGKWAFGTCNFATHIEKPHAVEHKTVNPLKASKRAARGRR